MFPIKDTKVDNTIVLCPSSTCLLDDYVSSVWVLLDFVDLWVHEDKLYNPTSFPIQDLPTTRFTRFITFQFVLKLGKVLEVVKGFRIFIC